jgi:hypothetical protein
MLRSLLVSGYKINLHRWNLKEWEYSWIKPQEALLIAELIIGCWVLVWVRILCGYSTSLLARVNLVAKNLMRFYHITARAGIMLARMRLLVVMATKEVLQSTKRNTNSGGRPMSTSFSLHQDERFPGSYTQGLYSRLGVSPHQCVSLDHWTRAEREFSKRSLKLKLNSPHACRHPGQGSPESPCLESIICTAPCIITALNDYREVSSRGWHYSTWNFNTSCPEPSTTSKYLCRIAQSITPLGCRVSSRAPGTFYVNGDSELPSSESQQQSAS